MKLDEQHILLYMRILNMIALIMVALTTVWAMSVTHNLSDEALKMGDIALSGNLTANNAAGARLFSVVPLVGTAMLLISLVGFIWGR